MLASLWFYGFEKISGATSRQQVLFSIGVILSVLFQCYALTKAFVSLFGNNRGAVLFQISILPRGTRGVPLKRIRVWAPWNEHPDSVLVKNRRQTKPFRRSYTPERLFFFPKFQSVITPCSCLYSVPCGFHACIRRIFLLSFTLSKHWMIPPTRMPPTGFSVHSLVRGYLP